MQVEKAILVSILSHGSRSDFFISNLPTFEVIKKPNRMPGFSLRLPCHMITGINTTLLERLDQLTLVRQST